MNKFFLQSWRGNLVPLSVWPVDSFYEQGLTCGSERKVSMLVSYTQTLLVVAYPIRG